MDKSRNEIISELRKFKKENGIDKIVFFGSRATDKHSKDSDVDLIVVSHSFRGFKSFRRAPTVRLKLNLDYPIDLLCYTPEEFKRKREEPTIVREAVREGIEI